jgi:hypothetical protein
MAMSIDVEKASDKIQHLFTTKTLDEIGTEETHDLGKDA